MKIGVVTFEYPVDTVGGGLYSTIVSRKLAEMGEEVHVFSAATPEIGVEPSRKELFVHRIPVLRKPFFNMSYWSLLGHKIRTVVDRIGRLDVLHSMGVSGFGLPKRSKLWKLNVLTMHHLSRCTIEELRPSVLKRLGKIGSEIGLMELFERACIDWADVVHAVSNYTRESIIRLYNKPLASVEVIPNAVPPKMLELSQIPLEGSRNRLVPKDCHNILYVGRVYYRKRIDYLLRVFARVQMQTDARLWIAGPGNPQEYRQMARELGIDGKVTFTGVVDRLSLARLFRDCDVFAFPSACEGFGIVLLEAMINGLPIVACKNTAIPEVVGTGGLLVDTNDEESFADMLIFLLENEEERRLLGEAGRERVRSKYLDWAEISKEIRDSYMRHAPL